MLDIANDLRSLGDFKRNTSELLERLKKTGNPLVLTINGKAEPVVQDAKAYQDLLDRVQTIEGSRGIGNESARPARGGGRGPRDIRVASVQNGLRPAFGSRRRKRMEDGEPLVVDSNVGDRQGDNVPVVTPPGKGI